LRNNKNLPKVIKYNSKLPCAKALEKIGAQPGDSVVLAPPLEVNEIIKNVPVGKLITLNGICQRLAQKHRTKFCCPLTTGIFVMIVANAAEETKSNLPYWRTIKNNGELNAKFPGGIEAHKKHLEKEGHIIYQKGKKYYVKDFDQKLI
jgi:alkylated DNA nucleotide flippase Atl1